MSVVPPWSGLTVLPGTVNLALVHHRMISGRKARGGRTTASDRITSGRKTSAPGGAVAVGVAVGVVVGDGDPVGVAVGDGVAVGSTVGVGIGDGMDVAVCVGVAVGVAVGSGSTLMLKLTCQPHSLGERSR